MKLKDLINKIIISLGSTILAILVIGALWQVFSRYVLNDPSLITEEILSFGLIWAGMLGACYAFSQKEHLALTFVKNKIKGKPGIVLDILISILIIIFALIIMVKGGTQAAMSSMKQLSPILKIPKGMIYSILPISGILIIGIQLVELKELTADLN